MSQTREFSILIKQQYDSIDKITSLRDFIQEQLNPFFTQMSQFFNAHESLPLDGYCESVYTKCYLLSHLISELTDNAFDAAKEAKKDKIDISIRYHLTENNHIVVTVADNGNGFSESFFEKIKSNAIESTKNIQNGTLGGAGVGLKQVISSIGRQDGSVKFYNQQSVSNDETGGIVEIHLPRTKLLTIEAFEVQVKQRKENQVKYARYAYTGFYRPPAAAVNETVVNKSENIAKLVG